MDLSYIIIPIITLISSQVLKLLTDGIKGNFDLKNIFISYGGMPSAHTAFAISISTLVGLRLGFDSAIFAVSLVFALLIMRDAVGFRNILGKQAAVFNQLIKKMPVADQKQLPLFRERMGHSVFEVTGGFIWGVVLTYILNSLT
ncbi:MAG: divergent PAP2 family protein [Candidatus Buchananbacteria bacterium]|nr:divergent PAP2 family protein [Candidatus Buchananbacteria bacterium]